MEGIFNREKVVKAGLISLVAMSACGEDRVSQGDIWNLEENFSKNDLGTTTPEMKEEMCNVFVSYGVVGKKVGLPGKENVLGHEFTLEASADTKVEKLTVSMAVAGKDLPTSLVKKIYLYRDDNLELLGELDYQGEDALVFEGLDIELVEGDYKSFSVLFDMGDELVNDEGVDLIGEEIITSVTKVNECLQDAESFQNLELDDQGHLDIIVGSSRNLIEVEGREGIVYEFSFAPYGENMDVDSLVVNFVSESGREIPEDLISGVKIETMVGDFDVDQGDYSSRNGLQSYINFGFYMDQLDSIFTPNNAYNFKVKVYFNESYDERIQVSISDVEVTGLYSGVGPNFFYNSEDVEEEGFETDKSEGFIVE